MYRTLAFHDDSVPSHNARIFALDTIRETKIETFQGSKTSRRTILVCSLILIATAGLLATWMFIARPKYYPKLQVVSRRSIDHLTNSPLQKNERIHSLGELSGSKKHQQRSRRAAKPKPESKNIPSSNEFTVITITKEKDYPMHEYRLPTNLIPSHYHINLNIDMESDNFTGTVRINFKCVENTDKILFHGRRIILTNARVTSDSKAVNLRSVSYVKHYELFFIELDGDLVAGDEYELYLEYTVGYGKSLAGLYKSTYKHGAEQRNLVSTHFEPTDARSAFPCFDEPHFKAIFHINITHSKNYIALSNMPIKNTTSSGNNDGLVTDVFEPTVVMSTYLVAFSVNDFKYKEKTTASGIKVRVYAREDDYNRTDYAVEAGAAIISFYEDFFKIKYPLPKLDLLAVPDFMAGAMEDWGLVSFRSAYLIFDGDVMTVEYLRQITLVIAHELAHQWFGNLVTMKWWNDVWLNEGFANFVEMLGTNHVNSQFNALDIQVVTGWQAAIGLDSLKNSHPVSQEVTKPSEIDELFDAISYNKGAALLRMLHGFMGDDFIKGVKSYLQAYKFGNAETDDLWSHLSKSSSEQLDVKPIMDTWARQRCFPILTISRTSSNDSKFTVSQESLLEIKARINANKTLLKDNSSAIQTRQQLQQEPQRNRSLWKVPFTYVSEESLEPTTVWLDSQETKLDLDTSVSWLKANIQSKGFYVVNYDNQTWYKLRLQLLDNYQVFSPVDRANIIHDVFKLTCEKIVDPLVALEVTKYMAKEHDYIPWAMMRSKSECLFPFLTSKSMKEKLKEKGTSQDVDVKNQKYIWKIQSHLVDLSMLNYDNTTAKRNLTIFERLQFVETFSYALKHHENKSYRKRVAQIFDDLVEEKSLPGLTAEKRALALMYGYNATKEKHWNYLWQVYKTSEVDTDRKLMMKAFGQIKDKKKIQQILERSLDPNTMRVQDTIPLLANIVRLGSRKHVWEFVKKNYDKFKERYGGGYQLGQLLNEVCGGFAKESELKEVREFLDLHPIGSKGSRTESQIIEKIENNIRRHSKDETNKEIEKKIGIWLEQDR